jgi:transposase
VRLYCGIDWAEDHHDIALVDPDGQLVARARIADDAAGYGHLLALLAEHGDGPDNRIPAAIETSRGLLVAALRGSGRPVFAINPMAVSRYRERHTTARKKSDHVDAMALANILRTDMNVHRPLPADSELARAIAVLARAQQDAVWDRTQASNKLRSHLREYYPAALAAFAEVRDGLAAPLARVLLAAAPTPARAARLTAAQFRAILTRAGRQRGIEAEAHRLRTIFRADYLHQAETVEQAMGQRTLALLRQLDAACISADELEATAIDHLRRHPDAEILTSFPGVGELTAARLLGEIGDDRARFADARALKAYAGAAPVTRASGKTTYVMNRRVKNQRLAATGYTWAFCTLTRSPGARAHYDRRRDAGDRHTAAQRNLFNRLLGCLHHCLTTGQHYDEATAFPTPDTEHALAA